MKYINKYLSLQHFNTFNPVLVFCFPFLYPNNFQGLQVMIILFSFFFEKIKHSTYTRAKNIQFFFFLGLRMKIVDCGF